MSRSKTERLIARRSNLPIDGEVVVITNLIDIPDRLVGRIKDRGGKFKELPYKEEVHGRMKSNAVDYMQCLVAFADGYKTVGMGTTKMVIDFSEHIKQGFAALQEVFGDAPQPLDTAGAGAEDTSDPEEQPESTLDLPDVMAWLQNPNAVDGLTMEEVFHLVQALQTQLGYIDTKAGILRNQSNLNVSFRPTILNEPTPVMGFGSSMFDIHTLFGNPGFKL
ncbi:hypothetical protein pEaSNUABM11_00128 [Erwinia phage pEa_SNUABM_11]|nr:hypothetical protein pEaSNUABM11_00128 [Erwinia phage pEa_SNUABM_11]